ncbi:MAG: UDP-galactopyranose mutase [Tyzzerella sp.]|nr:UDP-galactopyranose mutase [Tyzzerella sp.]
MKNMYDVIIVGAGTAGCTVARKLAEQGKKILILEKKNHIAGNCYDTKDEHGMLIHVYGPHIFHTSKENVYEFLSRFTEWYAFRHEVVANVHGQYMPVPFNLHTLKAAYGEERAKELEEKLVCIYGMGTKVPILDLMNHEDADLQMIGKFVYDNIYVYYTMKQWGKKPEEIDPAVTARVPVNISYDNCYFSDKYQGVPLHGFTAMFENMVEHKNITVELGKEAKDMLRVEDSKVLYQGEEFGGDVIFTGPIDEFFDCKYGRLPYRTLDFVFEYYEKDDFQGHSVVNYTVDQDYTRITEYKYLTGQKCKGTTISKEYPSAYTGEAGQIPYYSIANEENHALFAKYKAEVEEIPNFHLLGRLAEYQYYNIDVMVEKAMELAEKLR